MEVITLLLRKNVVIEYKTKSNMLLFEIMCVDCRYLNGPPYIVNALSKLNYYYNIYIIYFFYLLNCIVNKTYN